eukprot:6148314-Pleurochrysis_carterae.AAC.1
MVASLDQRAPECASAGPKRVWQTEDPEAEMTREHLAAEALTQQRAHIPQYIQLHHNGGRTWDAGQDEACVIRADDDSVDKQKLAWQSSDKAPVSHTFNLLSGLEVRISACIVIEGGGWEGICACKSGLSEHFAHTRLTAASCLIRWRHCYNSCRH